jgi:MFS transporter, ACS family, allantoate permease
MSSFVVKKMTVNAVFLAGYCIGQILAPQFWKSKYAPRYRVPWAIVLVCPISYFHRYAYIFSYVLQVAFCLDAILIVIIRIYLDRENKRRDAAKVHEGKEYDEYGYVERTKPDGTVEKLKVPIALLDITDKENPAFRYVL